MMPVDDPLGDTPPSPSTSRNGHDPAAARRLAATEPMSGEQRLGSAGDTDSAHSASPDVPDHAGSGQLGYDDASPSGAVPGAGVPATPDTGIGRRLRVLAGIDESVLDWAASERPRYTALGGLILGTATIAAFSMWMALNQIVGRFTLLTLPPALLWGAFVCNLDRWLVSSSTASRLRTRMSILIPRLFLAVIFGFIIAEPLVLKIFESAIEQHVAEDRQTDLRDYESRLKTCNPLPGSPEASSPAATSLECAEFRLVVGDPPDGLLEKLRQLQEEKNSLAATVAADERKYADLNEVARQECNGTPGAGLTGRVGEGPNCLRIRNEADGLFATSGLADNRTRLAKLTDDITALGKQVGDALQTYQIDLNTAIVDRVDDRRRTQQEIGLLERFDGLRGLVHGSLFLEAAHWLVRLFFITIDCLPVLVKIMSASTHYERMVEDKLTSDEQVAARVRRCAERAATSGPELRDYEIERRVQAEKEEIDSRYRLQAAHLDAEVGAKIDELTEILLAQSRTPTGL